MAEAALKEFFYVDVDRTRSLLAQLQGGVVESLTSETTNTLEGSASASFFGFGGSGGYAREARHQESRSFQEMIFVAFEALADKEPLITNLGNEFRDIDRWKSGAVHEQLNEGEIIRLTCDVQILDGKLFGERIARFDKMVDGVLALGDGVTPKNSTPKQRAQLAAAAKTAMMGGTSSEQLAAMSEFVDAFVGEGISMRALACGQEHLEYGFGGALLGRREYIQEERELLFSRYGTVASSWTCVLQVAAIPTREVADPDASAAGADRDDDATASEIINRAQLEGMAVDLLGMMEEIGVVEGPRWPTVSVTPLAVYRNIPKRA